ncbi:Alpha/Beta hydrolase protein [Blakeslea trispora]|nr:Alpha/Beta hydrolase protein [Blakeslea trispora]
MYLIPSSTHIIPVHPSTDGYNTQKLAVDKHEFKGNQSNKKIVFLFSHSNGFHKEAFHPLMKRFIDYLRSLEEYNQVDITFVSWDARNHGDSARLNDGTFSDSYRWCDNAMDTKQVIDQMRLKIDYDQFVVVGHSFGATSAILCEFFFPGTFDGLCIIEPVLSDKKRKRRQLTFFLNSDECRESLLTKKFFQQLHPEVLELYVTYGMYDTENGTIKLKCPREQEYLVFKNSLYEINTALRSLKTITMPIHFVYALSSNFLGSDQSHRIVELNKNKITLSFVEGSHMVPNELPEVISKLFHPTCL